MSELIDNQAQRLRTLKSVLQGLHRGDDPAAAKAKLQALVKECDASEIELMEQELIREGVPVKEIMGMCDLHAQVVRDLLCKPVSGEALPAGHPAQTLGKENEALRKVAGELRAALATGDLEAVRESFKGLMDVEKHYARKENLLFSCLERHGITGPSQVMWGKDDEARALLGRLGEALDAARGDLEACRAAAGPAIAAIEEMILKEEKSLIPVALRTLTETEWGEIWTQSPQSGWCLVEPGEVYRPPEAVPAPEGAEERGGGLVLPTGSLTMGQLEAIFVTLPVDLTFIDAADRVRFFSEGSGRIFRRSRTVIGRKVQHCHPPASVHVVEQILSDFREKRREVAAFWIERQGRFVHIRYFAVRDAAGDSLGTLEVTQDLTRERELKGERRLLQRDA